MSKHNNSLPWWGRMETLWLAAPLLCTVLYSLCLPISPNDYWYHVRAGSYIATYGQIPTTNLFSGGLPADTPYYYQSWLAELLLFRVQEAGLAWIIVLRAFCLGLAIALVTVAAYRRCLALGQDANRAAKLAAAGGFVALLMSSNNMDIRPQTFSVVFFALLLCVLWEWPNMAGCRRWPTGASTAAIFALWANTHGAFPAGLVVLMAAALGEVIFRGGEGRRDYSLLGLLAVSSAAVLLNPRGAYIYLYLAKLATLPVGQKYIQEWQSPSFNEWHSILFYLSPLALPICILAGRRQGRAPVIRAGQWLGAALLFWMAMRDMRAIIWFAYYLAPLLAAGLTGLPGRGTPVSVLPAVKHINGAILLLFILAIAPLLPWFKVNQSWPPEFRGRFAPNPPRLFPGQPGLLLESSTPVEAVEFLAGSRPRGRLFCEMVFGSYVMWALQPDTKPFADPRVELYPTNFWENYLKLSAGPPGAAQQLENEGFSDALLDPKLQAGLVARLKQAPDWRVVYQAGPAMLFRREIRPRYARNY